MRTTPTPTTEPSPSRLFVAVGELARAEREVASVLGDDPEHLIALALLAKIKHVRGEVTEAVACWAALGVVSVDDQPAQVCTLATTTCPALLHHRRPVTGCNTLEDDEHCGAGDFNDGRCRLNGMNEGTTTQHSSPTTGRAQQGNRPPGRPRGHRRPRRSSSHQQR